MREHLGAGSECGGMLDAGVTGLNRPVRARNGAAVNPEVDAHIRESNQWPEEITRLRPILLGCELAEDIRWGKPCYSHNGSNIVIIQEMKGFPALMFFKGALLKDPEGVLEEQGPNSRSARRVIVP